MPVPTPDRLMLKPAVASIILRSASPLAWCAVLLAICAWCATQLANNTNPMGLDPIVIQGVDWANRAVMVLIAIRAVYIVVREMLLWSSRLYTLDREAIAARTGIFHRTTATVEVRNIQQIVIDRSIGERLLGLGTICITSSGSQSVDVAWVSVSHPDQLVTQIRARMDAARPVPVWLTDEPCQRTRPIVIGLVGGIGAGKSAVANILRQNGLLLIDADRDSRLALDRPEVREKLVRWWGPKIILADGSVDRKAVAQVVFSDPAQRTRLEELVHPLVKASRSAMIERAASEGHIGVVIDAPLLYEAGSDKDCDAVIFVDSPVAQRIARVKSRGWDEAELLRRENAQISLEEKRRRASHVVINDSDLETLTARTTKVLELIKSQSLSPQRPPSPESKIQNPKSKS